jgi:serine/threonine-protein kinase
MTKSSGQDTSWVAGTLILGGRYRVLRHLGEGGMGVVYAVEHTGLPLRHAIKVLRRRFAQRHDLAGRLRAEAQLLAHLASHPNVVRVVDTGVIEDGRVYLLMELLEGRTLREELFYHKSFSPLEACSLGRQLVSALGAAHELGVIHRDVKPSNVFLTSSGAVKLLDFGVAKVLHEGLLGAARKPLTEPGSLMGTPRYMAPEYLLGAKATDGRVDLYSAGVVLWETLTGRSAFPSRDDNDQERMKVVHAIVTQGVPPLEAIGFGHLPAELRAVVRRATVADPEQRYPNAAAFIADLDAVAARVTPASSGRGRAAAAAAAAERGAYAAAGEAGEETLADEGATDPDVPYPPGFGPGAATTTAHAPVATGPTGPGAATPAAHVPGASLLPSSTTQSAAARRRRAISYQVALGAIVFSVGFLLSAFFVWHLTHRAETATPAAPPLTTQALGAGVQTLAAEAPAPPRAGAGPAPGEAPGEAGVQSRPPVTVRAGEGPGADGSRGRSAGKGGGPGTSPSPFPASRHKVKPGP